ncbi:hypothetical protein EW146_g539 [Bondarzewia mesenterica]|uniref:Uncharacterized protein n=1 Tax=Bondarzewia mesenterica TaxID=1095465 RepID=A0A4S4M8F5_9AGAM|nr:hypothetical protein EW146_g539 [Bondarzewia mesenterica]
MSAPLSAPPSRDTYKTPALQPWPALNARNLIEPLPLSAHGIGLIFVAELKPSQTPSHSSLAAERKKKHRQTQSFHRIPDSGCAFSLSSPMGALLCEHMPTVEFGRRRPSHVAVGRSTLTSVLPLPSVRTSVFRFPLTPNSLRARKDAWCAPHGCAALPLPTALRSSMRIGRKPHTARVPRSRTHPGVISPPLPPPRPDPAVFANSAYLHLCIYARTPAAVASTPARRRHLFSASIPPRPGSLTPARSNPNPSNSLPVSSSFLTMMPPVSDRIDTQDRTPIWHFLPPPFRPTLHLFFFLPFNLSHFRAVACTLSYSSHMKTQDLACLGISIFYSYRSVGLCSHRYRMCIEVCTQSLRSDAPGPSSCGKDAQCSLLADGGWIPLRVPPINISGEAVIRSLSVIFHPSMHVDVADKTKEQPGRKEKPSWDLFKVGCDLPCHGHTYNRENPLRQFFISIVLGEWNELKMQHVGPSLAATRSVTSCMRSYRIVINYRIVSYRDAVLHPVFLSPHCSITGTRIYDAISGSVIFDRARPR